jgi:hypothetical protein
MITGFPLRPPVIQGESAADHLTRLLQVNGRTWLRVNRATGGLLSRSFHRPTATEVLAAFGIGDADPLLARTPMPSARPRHLEIAGEIIHRETWTVSRRRWCPGCWRDDLAAEPCGRLPFWNVHRRFWWGITSIETCPVHKVRLREGCPTCGIPVRWNAGRMLSCTSRHGLLACEAIPVGDDDILGDAYVVGRLGGAPRVAVPFLDGMALADAIDVMQRLGAAALDGPRGSFARLPAERRPAAMSVGFRIARDWPHAFADVIADMAKASAPGNWGVVNLYGYLYDWIIKLPKDAFGEEMRRAFFGEVVRHGFLVDRSMALKYAPTAFVTFRTAAKSIGCSYATTRRYLEALGYLSPGNQKGTPVNIPVQTVEELRALFRDRLNAQETAARLGVGNGTVLALRREGLLRPDPVHERCNRGNPFFQEQDVDGLAARLKGDAPEVDAIPDGLMPLPRAAQTADVGRTAGACRLILDGWLRPEAVLKSGTGLAAVLTSVTALREAHRRSLGRWHTVDEVAALLGTHRASVLALARAGLLEARRLTGHALAVSDVAFRSFTATYVTSRELAAGIGTKSRYVTVLLQQAGVRPVADPKILPGYRGSLYRRSEVPDDLAARREAAFPRRKLDPKTKMRP